MVAYILRSIAKHNETLAGCIVASDGVENLLSLLNVYDSSVKEAGAWVLDYICRHNAGKLFII